MPNEILINFRDSPKALQALDAWAAEHNLRRSETLRLFVRESLAARGAWPTIGRGQAKVGDKKGKSDGTE